MTLGVVSIAARSGVSLHFTSLFMPLVVTDAALDTTRLNALSRPRTLENATTVVNMGK